MLWMSSAFGAALALATAVLVINGTGAKSLISALQVTARWSFLLFWLSYAGGSLATLFGGPFQRLARRGRESGLAYAAAHLIHLGLVGWLILVTSRSPLSRDSTIFFSVAIFWTYLLAILSFGGLSRALGSATWFAVRTIGLNYILFAFAVDFVPGPFSHGRALPGAVHVVGYVPFAAMSVAAPILVIAAAVSRRMNKDERFDDFVTV